RARAPPGKHHTPRRGGGGPGWGGPPAEETEAAMGLESPFDILGLYKGVALPHKSVSDPRPDLDMIFLYRRPILDYWCESGEDLGHLVRHVLIHEIGHHFGFSDEDLERIEAS